MWLWFGYLEGLEDGLGHFGGLWDAGGGDTLDWVMCQTGHPQGFQR